jgi:hypothetical protein
MLHPRGRRSSLAGRDRAYLGGILTPTARQPFGRARTNATTARIAPTALRGRRPRTPPERGGKHQEPNDGRWDSHAKAAETVADARWGGETASGVDASRSKRALYHEAKDAGIEGRSAMTKDELVAPEAASDELAERAGDSPSAQARPATAHGTTVSLEEAAGAERNQFGGGCARGGGRSQTGSVCDRLQGIASPWRVRCGRDRGGRFA